MKILFMSSSFQGGGITTFGHEVANAYSIDNDFSIIIGSDQKAPINTKRVKKYYYNCDDLSVGNAKKLINLINNIIRPDIIIGSNAKILPVIAQFLNDDIKIITNSHSLKYIEADVAAVAHPYVDHIIAGSVYNGRYMARKFGVKDRGKIKVIYNFVKDYPRYKELIKQKKKEREIRIIYPGACATSKSPEIVLQTMRKLVKTDANFKFYWMGGTILHMSRYFPFLHIRDIRELAPKDPRIVFTGRLATRQEAEDLIASGNVQFSPSRREGCPMSFLEAMRVGTIFIVADFGNFNREIVEKGKFGYVIHHNDIDGFADRIIDICKNPQNYTELYDNAYKTFISETNFDTWKSRMDHLIYKDGCNHSPRSRQVSTMKLRWNKTRIIMLLLETNFKRAIFEDIKVLLRMWKLKRREFIHNNR